MGPHFSGIDLIEIARFERVLERHGDRFLRRCFTEREVDYCRGRVSELAVRFAGKEATMKALGTGVRGISWREIEILANARGKPVVLLHGRAETPGARDRPGHDRHQPQPRAGAGLRDGGGWSVAGDAGQVGAGQAQVRSANHVNEKGRS